RAWQVASDRAYELAPHFAVALLLALVGAGALGFFAPVFAFLGGAVGGFLARPRLAARAEALGLAGLVLVGAGLVAFGARILLV
ncbi:MAG TPA: hypothetical protein VM582_00350, partial [Candidatus Thermoplasmatota archaeon]|nr:hypothetical protein [Candidatus Thermoplasmatota archaeon]